ncbi:MAG: hypothetical protein RSC19_03170, partial [Lachnospiraceae bacterium]
MIFQTVGIVPVYAVENAADSGIIANTITAFAPLEQSEYTLPIGADEDTIASVLVFPKTIKATVNEAEIDLSVTWESDKAISTEKADTFTYTAKLTDDGYTLVEGVSLPTIMVAVEEVTAVALAEGGARIVTPSDWSEVQMAINGMQDGGILDLSGVSRNMGATFDTLTVNKSITIQGENTNGHNATNTWNSAYNLRIEITDNAHVTLKNMYLSLNEYATDPNPGSSIVSGIGNLTIDGCFLGYEGLYSGQAQTSYTPAPIIDIIGDVTINGEMTEAATNGTTEIIGAYLDGSMTAGSTGAAGIGVRATGKVIVNGGEISGGTCNSAKYPGGAAIVAGSVEINGAASTIATNKFSTCIFGGNKGTQGGAAIEADGSVAVNGGKIMGGSSSAGKGGDCIVAKGDVAIQAQTTGDVILQSGKGAASYSPGSIVVLQSVEEASERTLTIDNATTYTRNAPTSGTASIPFVMQENDKAIINKSDVGWSSSDPLFSAGWFKITNPVSTRGNFLNAKSIVLEEAKTAVGAIVRDLYTPESLVALDAAVNAAPTDFSDTTTYKGNAGVTKIDTLAQGITHAIDGLILLKTSVTITGLSVETGLTYTGSVQTGYTGTAVCKNGTTDVTSACGTLVYTYYKSTGEGQWDATGSTTAPTDVGTYKLVVSVADSNETYTGSSAEIIFAITQKEVTVKAKDRDILVGAEIPSLANPVPDTDYTVAGFIGTDTLGGTISMSYTGTPDNTQHGSYPITISGGTASDNYSVKHENGTLTISIDVSLITAAITAANNTKGGIATYDTAASSVAYGTKFVTTAEMSALNTAIQTATDAKASCTTLAQVQAAAKALDDAVADFKAAIKTGTYTAPSGGGSTGGGSDSSSGISSTTSTTSTNPSAPSTGDATPLGAMAGVIMLGLASIAELVWKKKNR